MNSKSLSTLELNKILGRLAAHTAFAPSRELALALAPAIELDQVRTRQRLTSEACTLLRLKPLFSIGGARDLRQILQQARVGTVLTADQFLDIRSTILAAATAREHLTKLADAIPTLAEEREFLGSFPRLDRSIRETFSDRGEILDSASPALQRLRAQVRATHQRLVERITALSTSPSLRPFLQESIVTQREGRYVLPVRVESKGQIKGIVHDQSASGQTLYIEPFETVELNNEWRRLQAAEEKEVERILRQLSSLVASESDQLMTALLALARLDLALAKARYSVEIRGEEPRLLDGQGTIVLHRARHPLLGQDVVPIDVRLGEDYDVLVITGPNTGGKTVALKTIGLLCAMAQAGLHIPAGEHSALTVFRDIFADIGDEQSIEQSLSTFSSHVGNIVGILGEIERRPGRDVLVLLDELGAGTDPAEGSALARALIAELLERKVLAVATTHYPELKTFAYATPRVENASVEFDMATLSPTYRVCIGLPGRSNALDIASRLGIPARITEQARSHLNPAEVHLDTLLQAIHEERNAAIAAREAAEEARLSAEGLREGVREELRLIQREKDHLLDEFKGSLSQQIQALRSRLHRVAADLQTTTVSREWLAAATREVTTVEAAAEAAVSPTIQAPESTPDGEEQPAERGEIRPGDTVWAAPFHQSGEVLAVLAERGELEVQVGAFKTRLPLHQVEKRRAHKKREESPVILRVATNPDVPLQVDIRGARPEEALGRLEQHLNDAYLAGLPYIRIIHGKGTGVLRQVVREHVASHPLVSSMAVGDPQEGGEGVTIANIVRR